MTIAAGFRFDGGVFLCADSQVTYGGACKTPGQKLITVKMEPWPIKLGFAIAGDVSKAKAAIRNIACAVQALPQNASGGQVFKAIEDAQKVSYQSVFSHPLYVRGQGPDFQLLTCIWTPSQGSGLLATHEDSVTEVQGYDCKGSGEYLFRYLVHDVYRDDLSLHEVITLVTHAVQEIKAYDPNVGFNSEFLVFFDDKRRFSRIAGYDIEHLENFGTLLRRSMFQILFAMSDLNSNDDQMQRAAQLFSDNLKNLRQRYLDDKNHRNAIGKLLSILNEAETDAVTQSAVQTSTGQQ